MTVAVAHQVSSASNTIALQAAAREASMRGTELAVLHVVEGLDLDVTDAYRQGLSEDIERAFSDAGVSEVPWQLHLGVAEDDVAPRVLELAGEASASLLVIGARRRSPVGKFLLGSITQTLILDAGIPVLVVKPPR